MGVDMFDIKTSQKAMIKLLWAIQAKQLEQDKRLNSLEGRMDRLENRMDRLETRMDSIETRLETVENILLSIVKSLEEIKQK
jgi:predicted  nucleic acid-binding Zn-ribbon protein